MRAARLGLTAVLLMPHLARASDHPCEEIKAACEKAGFVKGEAKAGLGLWRDCIEPIVQQEPPPKASALPLPSVEARVIDECRAKHGYFKPPGPPSR